MSRPLFPPCALGRHTDCRGELTFRGRTTLCGCPCGHPAPNAKRERARDQRHQAQHPSQPFAALVAEVAAHRARRAGAEGAA